MSEVDDVYNAMAEKIATTEDDLRHVGRMNTSRKLQNDLEIMRNGNDLFITGINATGPVHQGKESIADSLKSGYRGRILVLDPRSDVFFERAEKEDDSVGRILTEMEASFGILHDVVDNIKHSPNLIIGLHKYPYCAMVTGMHHDDGDMQVNLYPEGRGVRGLTGKTYQFSSRGITKELFDLGVDYFESLKEASDLLSVNDIRDFRKELRNIRMRKYSI